MERQIFSSSLELLTTHSHIYQRVLEFYLKQKADSCVTLQLTKTTNCPHICGHVHSMTLTFRERASFNTYLEITARGSLNNKLQNTDLWEITTCTYRCGWVNRFTIHRASVRHFGPRSEEFNIVQAISYQFHNGAIQFSLLLQGIIHSQNWVEVVITKSSSSVTYILESHLHSSQMVSSSNQRFQHCCNHITLVSRKQKLSVSMPDLDCLFQDAEDISSTVLVFPTPTSWNSEQRLSPSSKQNGCWWQQKMQITTANTAGIWAHTCILSPWRFVSHFRQSLRLSCAWIIFAGFVPNYTKFAFCIYWGRYCWNCEAQMRAKWSACSSKKICFVGRYAGSKKQYSKSFVSLPSSVSFSKSRTSAAVWCSRYFFRLL